MRNHLTSCGLLVASVFATTVAAAPPIQLELATESGLQITAPREWLQLFAELDLHNVRIRTATSSDQPSVRNDGTSERPRFHVVGVLTASQELRLPGGMFQISDRQRLADYFAQLAADGAESLTSERGKFGLTKPEFTAVHADLAQPIGIATQGQSLAALVERLQTKFSLRLAPTADAQHVLRAAPPIADDVSRLSAGTGLAIVLHNAGLALRPEKSRGEPVALRIVAHDDANENWPIGWDPPASPRETAPALFEFLNVEIEGYTLAEAIDAIAPRIRVAIFWDRTALAAHQLDPATIQIHLAKSRSFYKRVVDRVLAQARLHADLRVDEAGTPLLWITR